MTKAYQYVRPGSSEQLGEESLERQREALAEFARIHGISVSPPCENKGVDEPIIVEAKKEAQQ